MATDQECVDYARECIRLAELTKDLQLRDWLLTTAREWMATAETKRSRADIARLSWSASLFELAMSASGHFRQIDPLPTLAACPLCSDRVRTFARQRTDAVCQ